MEYLYTLPASLNDAVQTRWTANLFIIMVIVITMVNCQYHQRQTAPAAVVVATC